MKNILILERFFPEVFLLFLLLNSHYFRSGHLNLICLTLLQIPQANLTLFFFSYKTAPVTQQNRFVRRNTLQNNSPIILQSSLCYHDIAASVNYLQLFAPLKAQMKEY